MASSEIKRSVGQGGKNDHPDVLLVQILLNKFIIPGFLPGPALVPDGIAGNKTRQAIRAFQAFFLGFNAPDGRVDPGGKTLDALNGPLDQRRWGDPHETTVQSVISTLRGPASQSLRFQMGAYSVKPADYARLAERFSWRRLQAYYDPSLGGSAKYVHGNDVGSGGYMQLGFPTATTATQKATVVHEATHGVCDDWGLRMSTQNAEALAHLAQAIYYYHSTGHHFSYTYGPTADVLTTAVNIAIRMKNTGNPTVQPSELSELYNRVGGLPSVSPRAVFVYDGL